MKIDRKLTIIDIILIIAWFYTLGVLVVQFTLNNRKTSYIKWLQYDNYKNVARALLTYKQDNQIFPDINNWYQVLLNEYHYLSINDFKGFDNKAQYGVALNKDLLNTNLYTENTVLIFSSFGEKNLVGNKKALQYFVERYSAGWIITVGEEFYYYDKQLDLFVCLDGKREIKIDDIIFD